MVELQNKTPTYLDGSRSNFPDDVDKIPEKRDLPPSMKPKARRFQELVNKDTLTSTEQEELNNLTIELYEFLPTAEDWNKAFDMSIATQKHYKDNTINHVNQLKQETTDFVNEKKSEITTYTDNMKNDVTTHTATEKQKISNIADNNVREVVNAKDEALLSIERKKDAIIEFLDGTDIGELRVDVGVMDELETEDKSSLVGAVNEVNKQVSEPKYVSTTSYDNVVSMPDGSTNGQISSTQILGLTATNLIKNGSFEEGINKWSGVTTSNLDTGYKTNGTQSVKISSEFNKVIQSQQNFTMIEGNKYYYKVDYKLLSDIVDNDYHGIRTQSGSSGNLILKTTGKAGETGSLTAIRTAISSDVGIFLSLYQSSELNPLSVNYDSVLVINLTQTFGEGNEPPVEECDKMFANWFDGTKSTISAMKVKSVGKNLFDGEFLSLGTRWSSSTSQKFPTVAQDNNISSKLVTIPDGVSQIRIIYNASQNGVYFYDKEGYYVNRNFYSDNFNGISSIPTGAKYVGVNFREINNIQEAKDANLYISTDLKNETYEPYKEDTSYVLAKQDNKIVNLMSHEGIHDEIDLDKEILIKRVGVDEEGQTYQLDEPEIIPIRWTGLQGYENGTVYFDTIIPEIGVYYNNGLQTHYPDHPIASVDILYKVDKETGLRTSLDVEKCVLAEDKLSFTHPDLVNGDLVDWDYVPITESTNGGKTITAGTNMSAAVDSLLKDNQTQKENIRQANSRLDDCDSKINSQEDKINNLSTEVVEHKADYVYQKAGGTATAITLTIHGLKDGYPITFIASANNNGAATTINGKPLYKPNTTQAPNLVAGKAYTVWYNSTNNYFFIKASAEGDASVSDVLAGKKFSNDNDTGLTGTMPNNGAINNIITTQGGQIVVPQGYHNGSGIVKAQFANLVAENVKKNINIGGVVGSYTPDYYVFSSLRPLTGGQYRIDGLYFNPRQLIIRTSITFSHGSRDIDADVALMAGSYTNDLDVYVTSRVDSSDRLRYTLSLNNVSFGSNYVTFYLGWDTYLLGSRPVDSGQYTSDVSGAVIE